MFFLVVIEEVVPITLSEGSRRGCVYSQKNGQPGREKALGNK